MSSAPTSFPPVNEWAGSRVVSNKQPVKSTVVADGFNNGTAHYRNYPAFRAHRYRSSLDQSRRLLRGPRLTDLGQNIGRQDTNRFRFSAHSEHSLTAFQSRFVLFPKID